MIDKQLYCVGARISWKELFSEIEKRTGKRWNLETVELEKAKKMMIPSENPNNPAESVLTFVQYAQYMESLQELHNDNERVVFISTVDPVDAFLSN